MRGHGASRIDRQYHWGDVSIKEAKYLPLAFSDHHGLVIHVVLPDPLSRILCPRGRPSFQLRAEVIQDNQFQLSFAEAMKGWESIKSFGLDTMQWWDLIVKPGIRKLAMSRSKQLYKDKKAELNLLLVRQAYLNKKVKLGNLQQLGELKTVHNQIQVWYQNSCAKVKDQSRAREFQQSEKVTIYYHEIHKKLIRKSSILKLDTEAGLIEGHENCSEFLENEVKKLLLADARLVPLAQEQLLQEVVPCFTDADNAILCAPPTKEKVKKIVDNSNLNAAPGNDGIPSLLYKTCWDTIGDALTEVMKEVHQCKPLALSLRSSLMVFGAKPKKPNSLKPQDKRRISLLNSDFKVASGLDADKMKQTLTHTLSPLQLVAGEDRRIHHGINLARDAIWAAGKQGKGCEILDTDLIAGFDYMNLSWCLKVMEKKGASPEFLARLMNMYKNNFSIVVVNNIPGAAVENLRLTLRQGDIPSMELFSFGIDPLLVLLERVLKGILIASSPVSGPSLQYAPPLPPVELRYKVIGYADDTKPAITTMEEFQVVDRALSLFERASGCRVHRDPTNMKCKFLPLQFMPVTQRGWSINSFALSKIWFRTKCVDLRSCDIVKITSLCKSWLYQDMLAKPEEMVLHRPHQQGGLGLHSVKYKAIAGYITTYLPTSANSQYIPNLLHSLLFKKHVPGKDVPGVPDQLPPYFTPKLLL